MVLYELVDLGMDSWDFYLGLVVRSSKPPIQVFVVWFWLNSLLVFEVVFYCLDWLDWF